MKRMLGLLTTLCALVGCQPDGAMYQSVDVATFAEIIQDSNVVLLDVVVLSGFQRYFCMLYTTPQPRNPLQTSCFIRISMNNSAAKVQKILEICKFTGKNFDISKKSSIFAPTYLKDIHNKDYSEGVNIQSGTHVSLFFIPCLYTLHPTLIHIPFKK